MKNKKGFTLTEILCVIVILGIITTFATTGIINMQKNTNKNMYCAKLELIKSYAINNYGMSHEKEINESKNKYQGYPMITIDVQTLVDNGFDVDKNNQVLNPIDNKSMNEEKIILYLKDNKIHAYIEDDSIC